MCSRSGMGLGVASSLRKRGHLPCLRPREQRCTEVGAGSWSACFMACPEWGAGPVGVGIEPEKVGTLGAVEADGPTPGLHG